MLRQRQPPQRARAMLRQRQLKKREKQRLRISKPQPSFEELIEAAVKLQGSVEAVMRLRVYIEGAAELRGLVEAVARLQGPIGDAVEFRRSKLEGDELKPRG